MKTFTKFCFLALVLLMSASLMAQQSYLNTTSNKAPDKHEMIKAMHGPTYKAPASPDGGKAVGDNCGDPIIITINDKNDLPYNDIGQSTTGRGDNYNNTCLNDFDEGEDIIYELVLGFDTTLYFQIDPDGFEYSGMALNEQCFDPPTATCMAVSTDTYNSGDAHGFFVALTAGTYYIIIDNWASGPPPKATGFDLSIDATTPVPNDDCDNATEIGEVSGLYFSTEQATESAWPGDGYIDIWYKYTATIDGDIVVSLCDSYYDSYLFVYDACGGTELDYSDNAGCGWNGYGAEITLPNVTVGDEFLIQVTGYYDDYWGWPETGYGYLNIFEDLSGCTLLCPAGGTWENENCGDDDNGWCDVAETVNSGDTICGTVWSDDYDYYMRDTDWFEIELTTVSNIKLAVIAEDYTVYGMVAQDQMGVAGCENVLNTFAGFKVSLPCIEDSIEFGYLPVGTYYFMVAPNSYEGNGTCYSYQAAFTVTPEVFGTITGTVDDGTNPIEGVLISTDVYTATTAADGTYSLYVDPGTYDVLANGLSVGYSTEISEGEVVTDGGTTIVDFTLNNEAPTLTASAEDDFGKVALTWTPVPIKGANGTDVIMGGVTSDNNYTPGSTMDLEFTIIAYTPYIGNDQDYGEYFEITLPTGFAFNSASDFPNADGGVNAANISGQTVSWGYQAEGDEFWLTSDEIEEHIINFTINVTIDIGVAGPQVCDYYFLGDGWTGDPDFFDGLVTVFEEGGAYVRTYNVYRKLNNGVPGNVFIPLVENIPDSELFDVIYGNSLDWCYYVTQNMENGLESAPSNIECVTVNDPCDDAIDYGVPGDVAQNYTLDYAEQVVWYTFNLPTNMDINISTCGSSFDTQFALYSSCDDIPVYPDMLPLYADEHVTDGCDGTDGQANEGFCGLDAGTYYLAVYGENGEFGDIVLDITQVQCLTINENWSGFSIYMDPAPSTLIADVLSSLADNMIITIRQNPIAYWWPSQNVNTIVNIGPTVGYKSKMIAKDSAVITGTEVVNKTVALPQGASYMPVRVPYVTDANDLVVDLDPNLVIIYDIYTNQVIWPAGGISTLSDIVPGVGYLINMSAADSYTFPPFAKSAKKPAERIPFKGANVAWNEVVNTGLPHIISIEKAAFDEVVIGDLIGVFNPDGTCVGISEVINLDENLQLTAFGDDIYTEVKDGFEEGEMMTFKLYRPSKEEEYALAVTFNQAMPDNNGAYAVNGLSMITSLKVGATDISENQLANVNIYPNPSNGQFYITGLETKADVTISNVQGQVIYNGQLSENGMLDLSAQPKGVYMIKLTSENSTRIQKVILK